MKNKIFKLATALVLLSTNTWAMEDRYVCQVKNAYELSPEAKLVASNWEKEFKNSTFYVDRKTGEIEGKVLTTSLAYTTTVINSGSTENSFKAIAQFEGQIQVIEIQEFRNGISKPFVALSMGGAGIVTGTCK